VQLVVGLGNPGPTYAGTRHNLGFQVLDEVARRHDLTFATVSGVYAWSRWNRPANTCLLLKPLTYMNRSGLALAAWSERNALGLDGRGTGAGITPVVVCDDLSLPLGAVRIRARGSDGGQKGLASIIQVLGGQEFPRLRLGIAPREGSLPAPAWSSYVLEPFAQGELPLVRNLIGHAAEALEAVLNLGAVEAASRFNRREPPAMTGQDFT
jgi:PTH1 family peptidyl-tRNA hydrolase